MLKEPLLIIPLRHGQLGNSLCTFANLAAVAIERGLGVLHLGFNQYAPYFKSFDSSLFSCFPPGPSVLKMEKITPILESFREYLTSYLRQNPGSCNVPESFFSAVSVDELNTMVDPGIRQLLANFGAQLNVLLLQQGVGGDPAQAVRRIDIGFGSAYDLCGPEFSAQLEHPGLIFFDGWGYVARPLLRKHWKSLSDFFAPGDSHRRAIDSLVECARRETDLLIGVHIRRGDYREWEAGRYFYEFDDYAAFMRHLRSLWAERKVTFLAVSDEKLSYDYFSGLPVVFGTGVPIEDMYALSRCDVIVGPTSTFAGWAAEYGGAPYYRIDDIHARPSRIDVSPLFA